MKIDESLLKKGATIGVALSGGRDSASLFHYLVKSKDRLGIKVVAINVEHGIRQGSKRETELIKEWCDRLGIEIRVYHIDTLSVARERKMTVEQTARELRYDCFERALNEGFCDVIATAHHMADDVETVLMRVFRGTGARGLAGIVEQRGRIIRPMLDTSREEIDEYVKEEKISFFEDETNEDEAYTRNFIRRSVLPLIRERYPSVDKAILRLARNAGRDEEYFREIVAGKIRDIGVGAVGFEVELLESDAIASRVIASAFQRIGVNADVEERHVALLKELGKSPNGTALDMPHGVKAYKEYGLIALERSDSADCTEIPFEGECELELCKEKYSVCEANKRESGGLYADADKLLGAVVRTKREGDIFKRFGGGTKSLGDYFTDIKLPVRLRDKVALIARGNEVLCIFGVEISDKVKIDGNTKRIFKLNGGQNVFRRS